jgi:hypothetical protein
VILGESKAMINPILFRGGMHGDMLLGMLDPTALQKTNIYEKEFKKNSVANYHIKYTRTQQKKFTKYNDLQKQKYYDRFDRLKRDVYIVTHDTDFSKRYEEHTVQLVCSDESLIKVFAQRFHDLHRAKVSEEAKQHLQNTTGDFVKDYAQDIINWQNHHRFKNRFDIKNIYNEQAFLYDFHRQFPNADPGWSHRIYLDHFNIN